MSGTEIGRARPDWIEQKRRTVDGEKQPHLQDIDWIYPPSLIPPDLPMVDDDEGTTDQDSTDGNEQS